LRGIPKGLIAGEPVCLKLGAPEKRRFPHFALPLANFGTGSVNEEPSKGD